MTDDSLDSLLDDLYGELEATAELPVARTASAYVGEAEAVARDLAERDASDEVVRERVGHVRDLLGEFETTENETADEHVAAAASVAEEILDDIAE
jgi:hypothetical protein